MSNETPTPDEVVTPLPCPFCGAAPTITHDDGWTSVACEEGACFVNPWLELWNTHAVESWNERMSK